MLALPDKEELQNRSRSKNGSRDHENSGNYLLDNVALKQLLEKSASKELEVVAKDDELRNSHKSALTSTLTSDCPELVRLMDGPTSAREISTQTSLPLDILEMEEAHQSIYDLINSRSSKSTQISSSLKKGKKMHK